MHTLNDFSVLILPGLGGAGEDHWQTHWERAFPEFVRVEQADWDRPVYDEWAARLTEAVGKAPKPVILVPHSAGTSLVMKWSFDQPTVAMKVAGAFMVAPSDRDRWKPGDPSGPQGFGGMILKPLPFPSAVVAGRDDDRVTYDRAQEFAKAWGSIFFDGGMNGHLGSAARLGLWPRGLVFFGQFIATLS
ncbi:MAG: alpha/beta hydrolase [Betaproteobacteria bacterium]|nr:alpha/beta hydrolase [Betaproteobacteria bacterium]